MLYIYRQIAKWKKRIFLLTLTSRKSSFVWQACLVVVGELYAVTKTKYSDTVLDKNKTFFSASLDPQDLRLSSTN